MCMSLYTCDYKHTYIQALGQDTETGYSKLAIARFCGILVSIKGIIIYSDFMYLLIKIKHNILIQFCGNYIKGEKFNHMLKLTF